jgi:CubicO group peptidase (beta-lactamase class C family)
MDRSGYGTDPLTTDDDAITPYQSAEDGVTEAPLPYDEFVYPPGGLVSSVRELGRFLRAMMTDGAVDGARVCEPDTVERLQRGRVPTMTRLDGVEDAYGFGWFRVPFGDDELVGHSGTFVGTSAYAGFLADAGLGIVLACNTSAGPGPQRPAMAALAAATGRDRTVVPASALEAKAKAVVGTYTDYRERQTVTVERDGGGLLLTVYSEYVPGEREVRLLPESLDPDEYRFYTVEANGWCTSVEFALDGDHADLFYGWDHLRRTEPAT